MVGIPAGRRAWAIAAVVLVGVAVAVVAARGRPEEAPERLADRAGRAIAARHWSAAESFLGRLARLRAPTAADLLLRAELENGRGRPDAALAALAKVPDADPLAARARLRAARIERDRGRMRADEAELRAALRLDPKLVQAHRELIYLYGMQARPGELAAQFRALAGLVPLNYDDMTLWTVSHQDLWINASIIADLERFLAADPADRRSRLALAEVHLRAGRLDEAESTLGPLPDTDIEATAIRSRIALDRSRPQEALALLGRGPAEHAELARLRGRLALRSNDPAEAARQLRIAVRLDPTNLEAVQSLGLALERSGDPDGAAECRERAGRLRELAQLLERTRSAKGRADRSLARRLGAACEAVGLDDEARGWYRLAVGSDPLDAEAQKALYRLSQRSG